MTGLNVIEVVAGWRLRLRIYLLHVGEVSVLEEQPSSQIIYVSRQVVPNLNF